MQNEFVIDIQNLTKTFNGRTAVDNISMSIRKGEVVGFLGPNGSGKTTTMRMLCGLLRPDSGKGTCLGHNINDPNQQTKHKIGYMTQKFSFYEDLTIRENLMFVARAYNLHQPRNVVDKALQDLGLSDRQHQLAGSLSGGWKQRLALAASIMHDPEVLLLDEPTAGVDPKARREFWDQIHKLAQNGLTVLVSTHYMDEAERCHRIAYILYGRMIDVGTIDELVGRSGLITWEIKGNDTSNLATKIHTLKGVRQLTYFGNALHVSGTSKDDLHTSMQEIALNEKCKVMEIPTTLEDVFISRIKPRGLPRGCSAPPCLLDIV